MERRRTPGKDGIIWFHRCGRLAAVLTSAYLFASGIKWALMTQQRTCEENREIFTKYIEKKDGRDSTNNERLLAGVCVASDDPRLGK
jgi:hypothetical protein